MRKLAAIVLLALLSGCSGANRHPIVGTWETNIDDSSGNRTQFVTHFRSDGTVSRTVTRGSLDGARVDEQTTAAGRWELSEQNLVVRMSDGSSWRDEIIRVDDETLYVKRIESSDPEHAGMFLGSHRLKPW